MAKIVSRLGSHEPPHGRKGSINGLTLLVGKHKWWLNEILLIDHKK